MSDTARRQTHAPATISVQRNILAIHASSLELGRPIPRQKHAARHPGPGHGSGLTDTIGIADEVGADSRRQKRVAGLGALGRCKDGKTQNGDEEKRSDPYQQTPAAERRYVSSVSWFNMKSATSAREMRTVQRKLPIFRP